MIQQDPWIGKTLGNCRIEKLIGKGAMSDVYLAHYLKLGIPVAIKIVSFINESEQRAKRFQKRFLQEVQFISKLEHPNIVKVYNAGEEDGYWYMIMEYVAGINLLKMIESKGHLSVKETLFFMHEIVSALKVSHEKGIIHRDIKPGNILITPTGHCKLVDFGLAKGTNIDASISHEGQIVGTIFYISPEQAIGSKQVDCRTDFYSLGVTLFQMLTGKLPYPGRTPIQVIQQHLEAPIPSVRDFNPEIPEILDQIIKKMMAKKPSQRYASANQILEQISLCYLPVKTKQRRFSKSYKYVGLIFSLLLLVFFTYLFKPVKNSKPLSQNIPAIQQIHKQQKENPGLITTQIETQFPETPKNKVVRLEIIPNNIRLQVHQSIQFTIKAYNEWNELVECDPFWISSGGNLVENKKTATFTAGKLEGRFIINVRDQNTWIQTQATVEITNLEQETGWFGELIPKGMRKSSIRGEYFYIKDDSIMMYVPAGDFWSGDNSGNEDEQPA
ncbi:MAG TPA: serine/threonine-protein kinase, partial [Planctomycetota bacterium]|nr:serine/threonine-protein kinase [Planctomycetota bacterium]